jgi:ABC-type antimicrobial peptide transport system permease subunit
MTPFVYLPLPNYFGARLVVRTRDPHGSAAMIRDTLATVSPSVEPTVMILADRYAREFARPRRLASVAGVVGAFALALAGVGLAGATAFSVRRRTREIGIRLALGADRGRVIRQFVREGLRPVVIGLTVGLVGALLMGRLIAGLLHGLSAHDPLALAGAIGVLLLSAVAAILIPLRRVVRLDPATVLRDQ